MLRSAGKLEWSLWFRKAAISSWQIGASWVIVNHESQSFDVFNKCYFAADKIDLSSETDEQKDYRFVKWLSKNRKLQGIPPSAFFSKDHKHIGENYIRFCFIKVT